MPTPDAKLILAILGPLFLLISAAQWWRWGALRPSGRAWLRVGVAFSLVAAWLWWSAQSSLK